MRITNSDIEQAAQSRDALLESIAERNRRIRSLPAEQLGELSAIRESIEESNKMASASSRTARISLIVGAVTALLALVTLVLSGLTYAHSLANSDSGTSLYASMGGSSSSSTIAEPSETLPENT